MQHMQDKDFDQLFKDKLAHAEIEPSAALWQNIEQQLQPKRRRLLPVYWAAAAVAIVAVTAGLLFTKEDKIQLQGQVQIVTKTEMPVEQDEIHVQQQVQKVQSVNVKEISKVKKNLLAMQPLAADDHLNLKPITELNILPVPEMNLKEEVIIKEEGLKGEVLLAAIDVPATATADALNGQDEQVERKGIRNIGDLVNFVVEKVDKREQKFLEFKTDDDDNSSLVAINIGIIKLNSRHKVK